MTMKKLFLTALLGISMISLVFAGNDDKVNYQVKNNFMMEYANAKNVSYQVNDKFTKISFTLNGVQSNAFYNNEGEWLATSQEFSFNDLPVNALNKIVNECPYPNYKILDCIKMVSANSNVEYFISFLKGNEKLILRVTQEGFVLPFNPEK